MISFLRLRILVLILGETQNAGWWKSQFLSLVGQSFLGRIYPRSTFAAAVRSAGRVARIVHDENVGKGAVFHLFRLPHQTEREIDTILTTQMADLAVHYQPLLSDQKTLLRELGTMAKSLSMAGKLPTPLPIGPIRLSANEQERIPMMAALYCNAFDKNKQSFPYFDQVNT